MDDTKEKIKNLQKKVDRKRGISVEMAQAFEEDDAARKSAEYKSIDYINRKQPLNLWFMWFVLGVFVGAMIFYYSI